MAAWAAASPSSSTPCGGSPASTARWPMCWPSTICSSTACRCMGARPRRRTARAICARPPSSACSGAMRSIPPTARLTAARDGAGWRLDGVKSFCSGALGSDRLTVSATTGEGGFLIGIVPTRREGVRGRAGLGRLRPAPDGQRHGALRRGAAGRRRTAAGAGPEPDTARDAALADRSADHDPPVPGHRRGRLRRGAPLHGDARPGLVGLGRVPRGRRSAGAAPLRRPVAEGEGGAGRVRRGRRTPARARSIAARP